MKSYWLHKEKKENCLVFCNGWGMDQGPFVPLDCRQYDVVTLYDYQNPVLPAWLLDDLLQYRHRILIGWSIGVWAGYYLFASSPLSFLHKIAVNGTLCPFHDSFGIPEYIVQETISAWGEEARMKFYRRMCRNQNLLSRFLHHQPQRTFSSQKDELLALVHSVKAPQKGRGFYDRVVVAERDFIIPTANQINFWAGRHIQNLAGCSHFPFYHWQCWEELLAETTESHNPDFL